MNAFWIVISALNFVLLVALVYAVARFVRWLVVGRRQQAAEVAELRERLTQLEAVQDRPSSVG